MKSPRLILFFAAQLLGFATLLYAATPEENAHKNNIVSRIPRIEVESSAIATIGYSRKLHALEIEFVNGAVYRYFEVPHKLYRQLITAESKARFYDRNIRGRYRSVHVRPRKKK